MLKLKLTLKVIVSSVALLFCTIATASVGLVEPLEPKQPSARVMTTRLKLESVTAGSVCGTTLTAPERRQCLGKNPYEIGANDTVSKLERFIIGAGNLCGIDERGVRCWAAQGTYERPIQDLLTMGDNTRAKSRNGRVCLPQADKTIHCFGVEQGDWVTDPGGANRYVRQIPAVEIYGPYQDLRDYRLSETGVCVLNGERVVCEKSPTKQDAADDIELPTTAFKGAKSIATVWGVLCVLSDGGLDCFRGEKKDLTKFHVEGRWLKATRLFDMTFERVCAVDPDGQPMCLRLGSKDDETTDATPAEFTATDTRVVQFKASGESQCALLENTLSRQRTFHCSRYGKLMRVPLGDDAVDFEVAVDTSCVKTLSGRVSCFQGDAHVDSPLEEDGSVSHSSGKCRWNNSRFHCASVDLKMDFSDIVTVFGASAASENLELPCVILENRAGIRSVRCFGATTKLASNAPELAAENVNVVASYDYACAYGADSTACWGTPLGGVAPPNLSLAKKIIFGREFACAKDQFGFVCWGRDLDTRSLQVPRDLMDVDSVADFAVGSEHVCAITQTKTISCWGHNRHGQLDIPTLTNPVSIVASGSTTCATSDEGVSCWGLREDALLATGQPGARSETRK